MTISPLTVRIGTLAVVAALAIPATAAANDPVVVPDFTKGAKIPEGAKHDWNLGPTGLRGWIYCDRLVTTDARQVLITTVDQGSPAADAFRVGDVILGVGGKPFASDPRTELGRAITAAESQAGGGKLALTRWRAGKAEEVALALPVLGSYGATAPFGCDKSKLLLEQGCKALAARMSEPGYAETDPIPRSLNALALLAGGNADHLPLVKKEAQWAAGYSARSMQTWYYGYCLLFLSEYALATGDESVLPGLKRLALAAARGQSAVGSWGHGFAIPDGRLGGYGMMNSPGLVLTIGLVLAREAGVKDAAVAAAIERSARLLRFYTGKGAIPYGDHHPWTEGHEDNGKCGMAAVLFNALGEAKGAAFFSRMGVAAHGPERDCGHCGNYFNMLWAMPGVALSGPNATGAWMSEFGTWYFDLARRWDGSYPHQGPPENEDDSFAGWDATGTYLIAYAMPLRKIRLTGAGKTVVPALDAAAADSLIADGRGWDNKDRHGAYDKLGGDQLVERLASWSPVVRERAALALGRRDEAPVAALVGLLDAPGLDARYGACQALGALGRRGEPAVDGLRKCLTDQDLWLRLKAAEALARIGPAANPAIPKLLELLAQVDPANDPRGMQQRYLTFALFDRGDGGLLAGSLDGVDREALYKAVRAGLKNQDGRARGSISSVYRNLSARDIQPLLPAIHQAITEPAPSGEMFADGIRVEGLRLFAKHHIEEGIQACVRYARHQNPWESQERTPELMSILLSYGTHAKAVIPDLTRLADYFEKDEPNFPKELMKVKAKSVRDTIRAIEAATEAPELVRLDKEPGATAPPKAGPAQAAADPPKPGEMAGYLLVPHSKVDAGFGGGFSLYAAAWPLLKEYPGDRFQTGLLGTWMFARYDGKKPAKAYSDIEGGLGWWRDTRFATPTPKFIMGGVAREFGEWANGPGAGKGRDWDNPGGKYGVAQLSPWVLWPPDGLNLKQGTSGELFGYGYLPLPLTPAKKTTAGKDVPTGDQCWTLFLNAGNFKGPVAFFTPYFWSKPTVADAGYAGQFLDARPADPNKAVQMETQYVPAFLGTDASGRTFARVAPTSFPRNADGDSVVVHRITAYKKAALWDGVKNWFDGGEAVPGAVDPSAAAVHTFGSKGGSTWELYPDGPKPRKIPIDWAAFATPVAVDEYTYGYRWDAGKVTKDGTLTTLPEYYRLGKGKAGRDQWQAVPAADVPAETGLAGVTFGRPRGARPPEPYVTPDDAKSCWKSPGPAAGPFTAKLGDGSVVTYSWYRFADQPALLNADLTAGEREGMQKKVELLHRNWTKDKEYLPPNTVGTLADLDPALVVTPPKGLEVGYVPIVTRQAAE